MTGIFCEGIWMDESTFDILSKNFKREKREDGCVNLFEFVNSFKIYVTKNSYLKTGQLFIKDPSPEMIEILKKIRERSDDKQIEIVGRRK